MTTENRTTSSRLNWRLLLGEFVVIVVGVLLALWVDPLREARVNAGLEVEYVESLVTDLRGDADRGPGAEGHARNVAGVS